MRSRDASVIICPDRITNWHILNNLAQIGSYLESLFRHAKIRICLPMGMGAPFEMRVDELSVYRDSLSSLVDKSEWEHPKVADCPQTRSLGLYKLNPPARVLRESAQADFVCVAGISNREVFLQKWDAPKLNTQLAIVMLLSAEAACFSFSYKIC